MYCINRIISAFDEELFEEIKEVIGFKCFKFCIINQTMREFEDLLRLPEQNLRLQCSPDIFWVFH